jgi:DNA-directed RNA polymerase specialized sigma24 family protein
LWIKIAEGVIPENKRRSAEAEDAYQETLRELDRELRKPTCTLKTREDIKKWGARVVDCNAKDVRDANLRTEGASTFMTPAKDGEEQDPGKALEETAGLATSGEPPAEIKAQEGELQARLDRLNRLAEAQLRNLSQPDQGIVEGWLRGGTYRGIAQEFDVTERNVRNTTFDFKSDPTLQGETVGIREDLKEAEQRWPGIAYRLSLRGIGARLLIDFREEP